MIGCAVPNLEWLGSGSFEGWRSFSGDVPWWMGVCCTAFLIRRSVTLGNVCATRCQSAVLVADSNGLYSRGGPNFEWIVGV
jgi:hypothetical protein